MTWTKVVNTASIWARDTFFGWFWNAGWFESGWFSDTINERDPWDRVSHTTTTWS